MSPTFTRSRPGSTTLKALLTRRFNALCLPNASSSSSSSSARSGSAVSDTTAGSNSDTQLTDPNPEKGSSSATDLADAIDTIVSAYEFAASTATQNINFDDYNAQNSTTGTSTSSLPSSFSALATSAYRGCPSIPSAASYPLTGSDNPLGSNAYLGGRDVMFFVLPNSTPKTGVMALTTFDPTDSQGASSDACLFRFMVDLIQGMDNFTTAGVESVLIDTSNNGGGVIVLNQLAQRLFTGSKYEQDNNFHNVLRDSPLAQALAKRTQDVGATSAQYSPNRYRDGSSLLSASANLFSPGSSKPVNGQTLQMSNELQTSIRFLEILYERYNLPTEAPFAPENIVFTGNGLCGSSCSSFTNFLVEYYNASAYIATGHPDRPIEFQAFAAGQSTDSANVYADAVDIRFTDTSLLPPLQVRGSYGFTIQGGLSPNLAPGQFLQYRSYPAQGRFGLTQDMYSSPLKKWEYVASQVFGSDGKRKLGANGGTQPGEQGGSGSGSGSGGGSGGGSGAGGNRGNEAGRGAALGSRATGMVVLGIVAVAIMI